MGLADPSAALEEVVRFRGLLLLHRQLNEQESGRGDARWESESDPARESVHREIIRLRPLVEAIAREIDPDADDARFNGSVVMAGQWGYQSALNATERLIGILEHQDRREAILGPQGPVLAAKGLHKWVWNAASNLWDNGHYKEAFRSAAVAVEEQARLKIDRPDLTGADIFAQAFSLDPPEQGKPRLRFAQIEERAGSRERSKEWTSAHKGAMAFGQGCFLGIRNLQLHSTAELPEQLALEYLAALSVLARWVNEAELKRIEAR